MAVTKSRVILCPRPFLKNSKLKCGKNIMLWDSWWGQRATKKTKSERKNLVSRREKTEDTERKRERERGVTRVSQKVYPFPSKKPLLRSFHLAKFIATSLRRKNDLRESVFQLFGMFLPTILEFDCLRKRATPWMTLAFTYPETSANRFSNASMRRKSQFFL